MIKELELNFENNDLHDSIIWSLRFDDELYFDIDYLVKSEEIDGEVLNQIIPVTLCFYDVEDFNIKIKSEWIDGFEIDELNLSIIDSENIIGFKLQEGEIKFKAKSFKAYQKGKIIKTNNNCLSEQERNGYNFNITEIV